MYLSIIIPVYNTEKYIRQCVLSCIQKTSFDYEIIIVDDGTTDCGIDIITDLIEKYAFIKLIKQKNQGLSVARNTGLKHATGNYIWFVDSDDWVVNNSIMQIASAIDFDQKKEIVAFDANYLYQYNTVVVGTSIEHRSLLIGLDFLLKGPLYSVWRLWYNCKYLIEKNILFIKGLLHEDNDFNFRALVYAKTVIYIKVLGYNYRPQRSGSIMNTISLKRACTGFEYLYISEDLLNTGGLNSEEITYLSYQRLFSLHWTYFQMYDYLDRNDKKEFKKELSKARKIIIKYIFKSNHKNYHLFIPLVLFSPYIYLKMMIYIYKSRTGNKQPVGINI